MEGPRHSAPPREPDAPIGGKDTKGASWIVARARRWVERLIRRQISSPGWVLAPIGALTAVSLTLALRLQLNMGFDSMLPESRPSVEQMHKVSSRIASLSTVFVVLEGQ